MMKVMYRREDSTTMRLIVLILAANVCWGAALSVVPDLQTVSVGESVEIAVQVDGLGNGGPPSLGVLDLDVLFDSNVLSFVGVTWGMGLDVLGLGSLQFVTSGPGLVNLLEISLDSVDDLNALQPSAFLIASLDFMAVGVGNSPISLRINAIGGADGASIDSTAVDGAVEVIEGSGSEVPEPGTAILVLLGVIVVTCFRRQLGTRLGV